MLTPSVVEQNAPIKSCLRFDKLIVLDSLSSPAASPKRVSKGVAHCRRLLQPRRAKPGWVTVGAAAAAACEAEACGPASASALGGSFCFGDWAAAHCGGRASEFEIE